MSNGTKSFSTAFLIGAATGAFVAVIIAAATIGVMAGS
jgi:hypothetical protein